MASPKNIPETFPFKMANGGPLKEKGILSNQWLGFKFISLSMLYLNFFYVAQLLIKFIYLIKHKDKLIIYYLVICILTG